MKMLWESKIMDGNHCLSLSIIREDSLAVILAKGGYIEWVPIIVTCIFQNTILHFSDQ
uniref:Uncharacterized protein n=1 Tax=Anguilla anguilla TaxID=7936 RepID=A0A0E9W3I9_ANGAN